MFIDSFLQSERYIYKQTVHPCTVSAKRHRAGMHCLFVYIRLLACLLANIFSDIGKYLGGYFAELFSNRSIASTKAWALG